MPLPSSGTLSLNQIHIEVGGGSGSQCSLGDSDISSLIGYGTTQQKSISNYYGASAGPSYVSAAYGTSYNPALTGKNAAPAGIRFSSSTAKAQVNDMTTTNSGYGWYMGDAGYWAGQYTGNGGLSPQLTISGGYTYLQSSLYNWTRSSGTGSGQHYLKVYYGSSLIFQTNQQYDPNTTEGLFIGGGSLPSIVASGRTNPSSWRIELYR